MGMSKDFYIIRGLPGAGKTSFIQSLIQDGDYTSSTDDYITNEVGQYEWTPEKHKAAIEKNDAGIINALERGVPRVFADGVFNKQEHFQHLVSIALKNGYRVHSIVVENRHGEESIHEVPDETMKKYRNEFDIELG